MALPKSAMILLLVMAMFGVCYATVYKVGDSEGWRYKGFDYQAWRLNKPFTVGDSLLFVYKGKDMKGGKDSVAQVDRKHYELCNATDPINETRSGNDTIVLDHPGHYFFITGYKPHCNNGQKLDIRVEPPTSPAPSPSHKSGAPSLQSSAAMSAPLMAMAVVLILSSIAA